MAVAKADIDMRSKHLQTIVQQIVHGFHPQKVILFGSYAYGAPTEDSDLDLRVVMDAGGRPIRATADIAAAIDHPLPLDIIVFEPQQLQHALEREFSFAMEVTTRGLVLYEA
jgi:uncharacterized protein